MALFLLLLLVPSLVLTHPRSSLDKQYTPMWIAPIQSTSERVKASLCIITIRMVGALGPACWRQTIEDSCGSGHNSGERSVHLVHRIVISSKRLDIVGYMSTRALPDAIHPHREVFIDVNTFDVHDPDPPLFTSPGDTPDVAGHSEFTPPTNTLPPQRRSNESEPIISTFDTSDLFGFGYEGYIPFYLLEDPMHDNKLFPTGNITSAKVGV
ncbi:hypothetical protein B0H17DRAFT_1144243 [Mycena rosella]|uniref:Uncharacterized protein n=1 Tax=Mycena rosella TaxID=1033263 RepID=A0AAD7G343_MYCRO|nr:hypothetical protein B0H17DRAFT_1144243 [Mycena rosella]